jgi:hypothetical protein
VAEHTIVIISLIGLAVVFVVVIAVMNICDTLASRREVIQETVYLPPSEAAPKPKEEEH